ncbi:PREDICTED: WUSCHEL-related homeobox 11 [Tarenaya hassleriana]|uniref:WUSCHEL-related homeobox 11 n=1 Tax=Tarenaya hassleriana TaxID=28532 RepID=UPI00053C6DF9|nr:PREDICTED: WUSCHEL-related homeobox 11 [Tarenaya hassleriana]
MEQQTQDNDHDTKNHGSSSSSSSPVATEPARTRWSPKPEQILLLESIFNSGMVNPPKDETVRIRKMLEKFGAVGDATLRRSWPVKPRRKQRQLQAAAAEAATASSAGASSPVSLQANQQGSVISGDGNLYHLGFGGSCGHYFAAPQSHVPSFFLGLSPSSSSGSSSSGSSSSSSSSSGVNAMENLFTMPCQMGYNETDHQQHTSNVSSILCPADQNPDVQFQQGMITVFINGVPTQVPRGPIHMKAMFGGDLVLLHSSGVPLPTDVFGFLMHPLQHGDAYFLVPRQI